MQNCCIKWEEAKITPTQLKKIAKDTKEFLLGDPRKPLDELADDKRNVIIPDVRCQTWLVNLGKFYSEMIRLKRKAETATGILATGLNTYICTQPINGCETACVGGGELMFYMPFVLGLKSDEVAFVYGHELYHTYQNIPERMIVHIYQTRKKELLPKNKEGNPFGEPTAATIMRWYREHHTLINIAADYEDNYVLQRVKLVDEDFLTGGDKANPRFCYREEYGKMPFEKIYDIIEKQDEINRATEKKFKPKKKVIFEGPVILEDPSDGPTQPPKGPDGSDNDDTTVVTGPAHVSVGQGKKGDDDPDVEINGPIIDNRTKKDDPFPDIDDDKNGANGEGKDQEGKEGQEGKSGGEGGKSGKEGDEGREGKSGGEGGKSGKDGDEGQEGKSGGGDSAGGATGDRADADGGGSSSGKSGSDNDMESARALAKAVEEWTRRRTGVTDWDGGYFSGTITGSMTPQQVERAMRRISKAISTGTTSKIKGVIAKACDTIVTGTSKSGHWGAKGHLWKKEVRPYSKERKTDARINLIYMFDNSGSMGAPLICSLIDVLTSILKEYEEVVEKVVIIPMRNAFSTGNRAKTDVIIVRDINKMSSAKAAISMVAGSDNIESFGTACAILQDPKIIDPSEYNVFLNMGDRAWADEKSVDTVCRIISNYCKRSGFNIHDMFVSVLTQMDMPRSEVSSDLDHIFNKWKVNTIPMGSEDNP
jgi:hypothetical protein